ncbi:MAG: class I SAM-dependent DNA methyltransferase, partial [Paludibacteraceae bacterium]|nr:class I SAM-dependent DNA methyltransferase [Paludibacteraceae bacterium]
MSATTKQQQVARDFAERWHGKGYEKGESQSFWLELLSEVFGVEHPSEWLSFEQQVRLDHTSFIDAYIPRTHVMIEQKSIEKDLGAPIKQSDGSLLNPFQQAKRYAAELPYSQRPRWIVTCNFREFWVYDMEQPNGEPQKILLENLEKEYYRLQFLVDEGNEHLKREMEVSVKAGELVGVIYDKLLEQYIDKESPETLRSLNILCVRLVFCLYAEDAGLFPSKTAFHDYLQKYGATDFRRALIDFFVLLDTPLQSRDPYLEDDIAAFPYVNGGLFSEEKIIIPRFTDELKQLILANASSDFDWSEISPTIFGAVFESTLNPETRRSGGMHYTSIENIHKVIDPLFMNDLRAEFDGILGTRSSSPAKKLLAAFQDKLASLTFFDPACGSGNFLTETFLSLRRLENEVIQAMYGGNRQIGFEGTIKVNISQFYGIEINDFACTVAKTALWIAESQMLKETSSIVGVDL